MNDWVLDWSAWEPTPARLGAARAALQAEALEAARLRARVAVVAVLHGARPAGREPGATRGKCHGCDLDLTGT